MNEAGRAKYPSWEPAYRRRYNRKRKALIAARKRERYASDPDFRAKHKARTRAYYLRHRDATIARSKAWAAANRERKNSNKRKRYREAHNHFIAKSRTYSANRKASGKAAAYRAANRGSQRAWSRRRSARIEDGYVREQLSKYSPLSTSAWPNELVEAKRLEIQLKRQLKSA